MPLFQKGHRFLPFFATKTVPFFQEGTIFNFFVENGAFLKGHCFWKNGALLVGGTLPKGNCFGAFLTKKGIIFPNGSQRTLFWLRLFSQCISGGQNPKYFWSFWKKNIGLITYFPKWPGIFLILATIFCQLCPQVCQYRICWQIKKYIHQCTR